MQVFIKKFAILNNDKCTSSSKLYNLLIEQFGNFEINYDAISKEEKELIKEKYRKRKKLEKLDNINIEDIINLKNIYISGFIHLKNIREFNKEMQTNLNTFEINNNKVVTELDVSFKRKNKIYKKVIYVIMTTNMEINIQKKNNIQYFFGVKYYVTPPTNKNYKLFALLAFNKDLFKTIICNLSIIENENKETFVTKLEYLKLKYNWLPGRISIDYSRAE